MVVVCRSPNPRACQYEHAIHEKKRLADHTVTQNRTVLKIVRHDERTHDQTALEHHPHDQQ